MTLTSFATVNMPFIRVKVPYLSWFSSKWSRTLSTKPVSWIAPDHIGPAIYSGCHQDFFRNSWRCASTHMQNGVTLWTCLRYWRARLSFKQIVNVARRFVYFLGQFAQGLSVKWLTPSADIIGGRLPANDTITFHRLGNNSQSKRRTSPPFLLQSEQIVTGRKCERKNRWKVTTEVQYNDRISKQTSISCEVRAGEPDVLRWWDRGIWKECVNHTYSFMTVFSFNGNTAVVREAEMKSACVPGFRTMKVPFFGVVRCR